MSSAGLQNTGTPMNEIIGHGSPATVEIQPAGPLALVRKSASQCQVAVIAVCSIYWWQPRIGELLSPNPKFACDKWGENNPDFRNRRVHPNFDRPGMLLDDDVVTNGTQLRQATTNQANCLCVIYSSDVIVFVCNSIRAP
jgi:hypothetical protein